MTQELGGSQSKLKYKVKDLSAVVMHGSGGGGSKLKYKVKDIGAVVMYDSRAGWRFDFKVKKNEVKI